MTKALKYDQDSLKEAVKNSKTMRQVALALKLNESGGTFITLRKKMAEWQIDITHFLGKSINQYQIPHNVISLNDVLNNKVYVRSKSLKEKLIKAEIFTHKCMGDNCDITEWRGRPLTLELDHIDGNKRNNSLTNLRLLCPNCHSQTDTWRGRKSK